MLASILPAPQRRHGRNNDDDSWPLVNTLFQRAHSHNDYHQERPLSSALEHGITSIEVDVFPRNNELWVGHTRFELDENKTLDSLYIRPLLKLLRRAKQRYHHQQHVLKIFESDDNHNDEHKNFAFGASDSDNQHLIKQSTNTINLIVDLKADPEKSIQLLHKALKPLRSYLSVVDAKGKYHSKQINVLVSGNRPKVQSLYNNNARRYLFIDGRHHDVRRNSETSLVPLVSLPWRHVRVRQLFGQGDAFVQSMVSRAHSQGKRVRFWGVPNSETNWQRLLQMSVPVDYVSIDNHVKYARFAKVWHRQRQEKSHIQHNNNNRQLSLRIGLEFDGGLNI